MIQSNRPQSKITTLALHLIPFTFLSILGSGILLTWILTSQHPTSYGATVTFGSMVVRREESGVKDGTKQKASLLHDSTITCIDLMKCWSRGPTAVEMDPSVFRGGGERMTLDCHTLLLMAVFHHGEPCTFRSTKNIIFGNKKKDDGVLPVLDSLDNYKILSERMNVLTIYLPWGN